MSGGSPNFQLDAIGKYGTNVVGFVDASSSDLSGSIQNVS